LHQFPFYPGTGDVSEVGTGDGRGLTVNVPLSAGADDSVYLAAFSRLVAPVASEFAPSLVLLSAGFDAHERDPLAEMRLTEAAYAEMLRLLGAALPARTPIGMLLEGGYDLAALEASLASALGAMLELGNPPPPPPSGSSPGSGPASGLSPRHAAELDRALTAASAHWHL
jgi:acetoin utilization deacetylase AcuC-like enzyme